jgi:peptidoglycan/xylan/chitin deacetylase (PgdA/CDA1 family)
MKAVILCYHKVGIESEEGRWLNCSPENLMSHANFFVRRNFNYFLPKDFAPSMTSERNSKRVCFTFDDAYVSAVQNAPPVLESVGFRGCFYAVPSLVGMSSLWDGERARPLATWAELLRIQSAGHEVGNHTFTHPKMSQLDYDEQLREWQLANEMLRDNGIEVQSGCFPYGDWCHDTLKSLRNSGIPVGLQLGKRPVGDEPTVCLPRVIVSFSDRVPKLIYKIWVRPKLRRKQ